MSCSFYVYETCVIKIVLTLHYSPVSVDPVTNGNRSSMASCSGRLVISSDTMLNARKPLGGVLLTDTLFQSSKHVSNAIVKIEVLSFEVSALSHYYIISNTITIVCTIK